MLIFLTTTLNVLTNKLNAATECLDAFAYAHTTDRHTPPRPQASTATSGAHVDSL